MSCYSDGRGRENWEENGDFIPIDQKPVLRLAYHRA